MSGYGARDAWSSWPGQEGAPNPTYGITIHHSPLSIMPFLNRIILRNCKSIGYCDVRPFDPSSTG